mmetsp:Transcript_12176/g.24761  ORF Transcript_12176/g.24761 Transcript_12176/m.24761 type:complete len:614 (+) Transcript_12176:42-1883(+)|eukprot:CAMPEP_0119060370 /NCGR_PEP_ID=MMETSP1178-20130426/4331_1 /TAXON_ID=33656 /ORGANISM="unid sp, Strain CCMP2000" /LENGTH=613 /DNA_ID=CAMNT_0007041467 /DNA_START=42 /DNA_END=1883 /DNA_ORIENTATION=-
MRLRSALAFALLLALAESVDRAIDEPEDDDEGEANVEEWHRSLADFKEATAAATKNAQPGELIPKAAEEWYTVTIADVSVGFMHTTTVLHEEDAKGGRGPGVTTTELMDVQVSRGTDTSRMAFETIFTETGLDHKNTTAMSAKEELRGGVKVMAYDQRFANNEVKMNVSFTDDDVLLTSNNGNAEHISEVDMPVIPWLGRMRAKLEFARQCREGKDEIIVQTMRPELGPKVVNLSSSFVRLNNTWDGEKMVTSSVWTVQISDVPVNMTEVYATDGPDRCFRLLQMGLDMPFGFLLASLSTKPEALAAAEHDPTRVLPELVYTMFVPLAKPIPRANDARSIKIAVSVSGSKGPAKLELPTGGYQRVTKSKTSTSKLFVSIDLLDPVAATEEELSNKEYMSPSAMVDNADEVVIDLAHSIDGRLHAMAKEAGLKVPGRGEVPPAQLQEPMAYQLRDLVSSHIKDKHLSTAYASASETARTGSGDCTEHAVLLAALLKARMIPSRVCHGLVYVEQGGSAISGQAEVDAHGNVVDHGSPTTSGQYGWHMWSQALINGHWHDLDATLHIPYTVGHVLVGTSSMADKEAHNNHMQMAALIGNLAITVQQVSHDWGPDAK